MLWLIVPPDRRHELDVLNDASPFRKLIPKSGIDGKELLPVAVLQDCGQDQTWGTFGAFVTSLAIEESVPKLHESIDMSPATEKDKTDRQAVCNLCPFYNERCTVASVSCVNCGKPENKYGTCPKNYW